MLIKCDGCGIYTHPDNDVCPDCGNSVRKSPSKIWFFAYFVTTVATSVVVYNVVF